MSILHDQVNNATLIGFGLFVASELVGMSKYRQNSLLQVILTVATQFFPYEIKPKQKHPAVETLGRILQRPSAAPYSEDVLEDMTVKELRNLARAYGEKELGHSGRRADLVRFLLTVTD